MSKKGKRSGKSGNGGTIEWEGLIETVEQKSKPYSFGQFERCHQKHPTLKLGGGTLVGASCNAPRKGFDVYVGLDWGMHRESMDYPWEPKTSEVVEVYFPIRDGSVPANVGQFKKMVVWLGEQLAAGKRVHIGCIGGHGRTGTLLSALVKHINGEADATTWVRANYCQQAVETTEQVEFLKKHFGIEPVIGSRKLAASSKAVYGGSSSELVVSRYTPLKGGSVWSADWVHGPEAA